WQVSPFDLFAAYGVVKARTQPAMHVVHDRRVMTLGDALARGAGVIGAPVDWTVLEAFLPSSEDAAFLKSALASSFVAALELARQGRLEIAQEEAFTPLKVRAA